MNATVLLVTAAVIGVLALLWLAAGADGPAEPPPCRTRVKVARWPARQRFNHPGWIAP